MGNKALRTIRRAALVVLTAALSVLTVHAAPASAAPTDDFKQFNLSFDIGDLSNTNSCIPAWAKFRYRDPASGADTDVHLIRSNANGCDGDQEHLQNWGDFQNTNSTVFIQASLHPGQHLLWGSLTSFTLTVTTPNTPAGRQKCVKVNKFSVWGQDTNNFWHELVNNQNSYTFCDGHNDRQLEIIPSP